MSLLPTRLSAHIARSLDELVPCNLAPILILQDKHTGQVDVLSRLPPRVIQALIVKLAEQATPDEVDILRA